MTREATDGAVFRPRTGAVAWGVVVLAALIVGCGSRGAQSNSVSSQTSSVRSQTSSVSSAAGFKSCQGTAGANGYFRHLEARLVSCEAGRTVMNSYVKVFLDNGSRPPSVVNVQGFSCVLNHPNGDTRIDNVLCKGVGDNSAVRFGGRSRLPQPSG
jgi:hypothetical protein